MRRNKYNVADRVDRTMDGIVFDSKREMLRYSELKMLERCGIISELRLQVPYVLMVNGVKICTYIADFVYRDQAGKEIVEDSKGHRTREYILKTKLMIAIHGIRVVEV